MNPAGTKRCSFCRRTKSVTEFHRHPNGGYHSRCKKCRSKTRNREKENEAARKYRAAHREEILLKLREYRVRNADRVKAYREATKEHHAAYHRRYYRRNRAEILRKNRRNYLLAVQARQNPQLRGHLRRKFGLTLEQYERMCAAQANGCAICGREETVRTGKAPPRLRVDHCHRTGKVRALLCHRCNAVLGLVDDDPVILQSALAYLRRHR